jgi:hypothetical protein
VFHPKIIAYFQRYFSYTRPLPLIMKKNRFIILTIVILSSFSLFSQNAEQVAVNYFAKEIIPNLENIRIKYDGKIEKSKTVNHTAKELIHDYFGCKYSDPEATSELELEKYPNIYSDIANSDNLEFNDIQSKSLKIPNGIKFRKRLNTRPLTMGTINFYVNKFWHSIFPFKYNLHVEPSVNYQNLTYVRLKANQNDYEKGLTVIIQLNEKMEVINYCEEYWMQ